MAIEQDNSVKMNENDFMISSIVDMRISFENKILQERTETLQRM